MKRKVTEKLLDVRQKNEVSEKVFSNVLSNDNWSSDSPLRKSQHTSFLKKKLYKRLDFKAQYLHHSADSSYCAVTVSKDL